MIKTDFQNKVIDRIRQLLINNDISQIGLANIIEVSNGQIGNIESPKFRHKYTIKHLYTIAHYFNVSLDYILTGKNEKLDSDTLIQILIEYDE
jgi:putative transcriptional regulator